MSHRLTAQAVPNPGGSDFFGRHVCISDGRIAGSKWMLKKCGAKFWLRSSYEDHWLREHAPKTPRPAPQPPMSVEEQGRRLASRRDDLIALGVPDYLLDIPIAPGRYATRAPISAHDLGDIIAQRVRTVPDWALGPHCPHPEPHYQHDALCVIAEDGYHLTRKDTP